MSGRRQSTYKYSSNSPTTGFTAMHFLEDTGSKQHECISLQRIQLLKPEDNPFHKAIATWFLQQSASDRAFAASVFFTDETYFTCGRVFNQHNAHVWALENPQTTQPRAARAFLCHCLCGYSWRLRHWTVSSAQSFGPDFLGASSA